MSEPAADSPAPTPSAAAAPLKRTPFHDFHVEAGARLVPFAGWEMPLVYTSIGEEHRRCRTSGAFFDVSHMGRLRFHGPDAARFLDLVTTRATAKIQPGQSRYALVCNDSGGVMDDVIIAHRDDGVAPWSMVCNASNREKLLGHFEAVRHDTGLDVRIADVTEQTAMGALQGPAVLDYIADTLAEVVGTDIRQLKRFGFATGRSMGHAVEVYRSGYTGEDGVEVIVPAELATMLVQLVGDRWREETAVIAPAGLGARDTLRIEAAMPLYGHELTEEIDPIAAGLGWAVNADDKEFLGGEPIREVIDKGPKRQLVGLELDGRRTARQGTQVTIDGLAVGVVTSGTFSPTLEKSIAMAYVALEYVGIGTKLGLDFKRETLQGTVVPLPFYKRER